jgi:putative endonuclease
MFYAYVLKAWILIFTYKGHCQDVDERLKQHNQGLTSSIKKFAPFEIVYFEEFERGSN